MDLDFSAMVGSLAFASLVTAIIAFGVIELFPNFTMWAVDKVAGFFGQDPVYDRPEYHQDDPD